MRDHEGYVGIVLLVIMLALILSCYRCGGATPVPTPTGPTVEDVCNHYREMGCEEGDNTPKGARCEQWLSNAAEIPGITDRWPCIVVAQSCETARECERQ